MAQWKKVFSFLYQPSCQYYFMLKINYIILAESTCCVFLVFPKVLEEVSRVFQLIIFYEYIFIWEDEYRNTLTIVLPVF